MYQVVHATIRDRKIHVYCTINTMKVGPRKFWVGRGGWEGRVGREVGGGEGEGRGRGGGEGRGGEGRGGEERGGEGRGGEGRGGEGEGEGRGRG